VSARCQMVSIAVESERLAECGRDVVGVTEDGLFICESCAIDHEAEGFRVDRSISRNTESSP
jgi:hypothetical protein